MVDYMLAWPGVRLHLNHTFPLTYSFLLRSTVVVDIRNRYYVLLFYNGFSRVALRQSSILTTLSGQFASEGISETQGHSALSACQWYRCRQSVPGLTTCPCRLWASSQEHCPGGCGACGFISLEQAWGAQSPRGLVHPSGMLQGRFTRITRV